MRSSRNHILYEFHMAGSVDDCVTPLGSLEENLCCVDRNSLLTLFFEVVQQICEFRFFALPVYFYRAEL